MRTHNQSNFFYSFGDSLSRLPEAVLTNHRSLLLSYRVFVLVTLFYITFGFFLITFANSIRMSAVRHQKRLLLLRMEQLSPNVLLCLFEGEVKTVDIHQKPETLHFGIDTRIEKNQTIFYKKLRNKQGSEISEEVSIPWKEEAKRVIDIAEMAARMAEVIQQKPGQNNAPFTSAQLALEMIEGVKKVRLVVGSHTRD
jgi:hypothetical protein